MAYLQRHRYLAPLLIGLMVFAANMAVTRFAWTFDQQRVEKQVRQIGEIYLDGFVSSIRASVERGLPGDVDRRMRVAMSEQYGIEERLLAVFDSKGEVANVAGDRLLLTEAVKRLAPGATLIDFDSSLLTASRRIGDDAGRATVVLNVRDVIGNYRHAERTTNAVNLAVAAFAALLAAMLLGAAIPKKTAAAA